MLPEAELEQVVAAGDFTEDFADAYGEIANIIAGCYTVVFEEQHDKTIGFTKTDLETIIPTEIDPDLDESIPNQGYYLSSATISFNERKMGQMQMLVPAAIFKLELLLQPEVSADQMAQKEAFAGDLILPDMLIISDDNTEAGTIASELKTLGYKPKVLHFKDSFYEDLLGKIHCIFLVMSQVNEQGFGVAIKVNSIAPNTPLVLAGSAWTRTLVLKAVKYGANDILITPSSPDDVKQKIEDNLRQIAA